MKNWCLQNITIIPLYTSAKCELNNEFIKPLK